jgi:hypothetical protein
MTTRPTTTFPLRAALCLAIGAAVLATSLPARAGDDDDESFDTKIFHNVMKSIGLQSEHDGSGIDYHERSPLVIPPSRSLPPPEADAAAKNPNWPVDPEIKRAKQAKAAEKKYFTGDDFDTQARPLSPGQMEKGPRTSSSRDAGAPSDDESSRVLKPSELGYKGGMFGKLFGKEDDKPVQFTGEPPRASLTDPPSGYQTPSPTQVYGKGADDHKPQAYDYGIQHGTDQTGAY